VLIFFYNENPISWNTTSVAIGAAIYAYAVIPNFLVYEDSLNMEAVSGDISLVYLEPEGGYIEWSQAPALRSWRWVRLPPLPPLVTM
jgi:hypothetical protein